MKKALTAVAAAALIAAFTAPVSAQQPTTAPAKKGQAAAPANTDMNKRSESGAATTTGAGAATGAGQPQGVAQPPQAQSAGGLKDKSQAKTDPDSGKKAKATKKKSKKAKSKAKADTPAADAPAAK